MPLYLLIRRLFFADLDDFFQAIQYWWTPDLWSMFRGEYFEDWWAEVKLGLYIATCAALVFAEFLLLSPLVARYLI